MQIENIIDYIVTWLKKYQQTSGLKGFAVGVSGGIDSAVTSTLCAMTDMKVLLLNMPIYQADTQYSRASEHIRWLKKKYPHVSDREVLLDPVFDQITRSFPGEIQDGLTMANARSRLRMLTLYAFASHYKLLVAGTGNKVEDFGVGFFTKYGDGGVDISPIADLMKSEVYLVGEKLGIIEDIIQAPPTDGLFDDTRTDEDQIGASYPELEWAMTFQGDKTLLDNRQKEVLAIFERFNTVNQHKMHPIPVCRIPQELK